MSGGGSNKRQVHIHGEKGVYHAGEWMDMESYGKEVAKVKEKVSAAAVKRGKGDCGASCETCPRSQSCHSSAKSDGSYDVIVIGAGCIGASVARELSKTTSSVLWLEAADDVSQGATKGNSGIVHAGFDDKPGSVRSKYCWRGNQMFPQLDRELNFGYQRNGSLVLATKQDELKVLEELKERGQKNGVQNLQILKKDEVFKKEPYLNKDVIGALYSPDAGNLIPYEFTIALAENAVDNGVQLKIRREVTSIASKDGVFEVHARYWEPNSYVANSAGGGQNKLGLIGAAVTLGLAGILISQASVLVDKVNTILVGKSIKVTLYWFYATAFLLSIFACFIVLKGGKRRGGGNWKDLFRKASKPVGNGGTSVKVEDMNRGGSGSSRVMGGKTVANETYRAKYIVNCAGTYSDKISAMIGDDSFKVKPRIGDYLLLQKEEGYLATHTLFPCPDEKLGKGVLVQTTLWGNLILGPTARDMHVKEVAEQTSDDIQEYILSKCKALVPSFDASKVFHSFAGARAKTDRGDWIIEASPKNKNFIQAAGIDSPGLAGSPAIALEVVNLLGKAGLKMTKNETFNPYRAPIIVPKNGWNKLKPSADIEKSSSDPSQNVVCKCEKVTEAEVVDALHRSLPLDSTQAIRKRTRAGMGSCQGEEGNYNCECRVAAIIARETGFSVDSVGRRPWPATSTLSQRWIDNSERQHFETLKAK